MLQRDVQAASSGPRLVARNPRAHRPDFPIPIEARGRCIASDNPALQAAVACLQGGTVMLEQIWVCSKPMRKAPRPVAREWRGSHPNSVRILCDSATQTVVSQEARA